jgi:enterochelin esterase-like enzyme
MRRPVRWSYAAPTTAITGIIICLHGRNGNRRRAFDSIHLHDVAAAAGQSFAIVGVDGGAASYWHQRADGTDARRMVIDELIPVIDERVGSTVQRAIVGWSMGGYGALLIAETEPTLFRAVVAASPALWERSDDAAPGAFDSPADFASHNVFTDIAALRPLAVRIDCGSSDGFVRAARRFADQLPSPNLGTFSRGYHDAAYWRSIAPGQLSTIADAFRRTA